tara:strand:- start:1413 stop:1871 length:459 start_codon:yes stop_codon:yes gene_type:complete
MIPSPTPIPASEALQWLTTAEMIDEIERRDREPVPHRSLLECGLSKDDIKQGRAAVTVCADAAGISTDDILGESRVANIALPRQVAMYILRGRGLTLCKIRDIFGKSCHTTIIHAEGKVRRLIKNSQREAEAVQMLTDRVAARLEEQTSNPN